MNDTPDSVRDMYRAMLMKRSGAERLLMGCDMFDTSRALVLASANTQSKDEIRVHLFCRTYGQDFDAKTAARIISGLCKASDGIGASPFWGQT